MSWPTISDAEVGSGLTLPDVRAAVSGALAGKMRERDRRLWAPFTVPSDLVTTTSSGTAFDWASAFEFAIKPPTHLRGDAGSRLKTEVLLSMSNYLPGYQRTLLARVKVNGYATVYSNEISLNNPTTSPTLAYEFFTADGWWMYPHSSGPTLIQCVVEWKFVSDIPVPFVGEDLGVAIYSSWGAVHYIHALPV